MSGNSGSGAEHPDAAGAGIQGLHDRIDDLERDIVERLELVAPGGLEATVRDRSRWIAQVVPAWRRPTQGEARWPVTILTAAAIALQIPVRHLAPVQPTWILPALEGLLLAGLVAGNPNRINSESRVLRWSALALAAFISFVNGWSVVRLVLDLVHGKGPGSAGQLLVIGGAIWLTNIVVFALWYWEFDRGGPAARAHATHRYPDFMFTQMASKDLAPPDWEPAIGDYLYLAFTNATAFSPTDVMPLSRWAKMAMTAQSLVSVAVVALIVARAVNVLA